MDQFTKEGRKLRPRKTAGPRPVSEKVEYTPGESRSNFGDRKPRPYGERDNHGYGARGGNNHGGSSRGGNNYGSRSSYGARRNDGDERRPYGEGRSNFSDNRSGSYGERKPRPYGESRSQRPYGESRSNFGEHRNAGPRKPMGGQGRPKGGMKKPGRKPNFTRESTDASTA